MPGHGNSIMHFIERKLLGPAVAGMILGLLVRSIALVVSVAVPYSTWNIFLRIGIEIIAAFGMVACADIVGTASSAARAAISKQIAAVMVSDEYFPNPRLKGERYQQEKAQLEAKREYALKGLRAEGRRELFAMIGCAIITVSFGVLFGVTTMAQFSVTVMLVEIIGVAAIPFILWYISAQYKEQQASPEMRAQGIAVEAVDSRLRAAQTNLASSSETPADLELLDMATKGSPAHNRLVKALKTPPAEDEYMTTPQIYQMLGATTPSAQSTIRRIVRRAGEKRQHGVVQHPETEAWMTPKAAFVTLFGHLVGQTTLVGKTRTSASAVRAILDDVASVAGASLEQMTDTAQDDSVAAVAISGAA